MNTIGLELLIVLMLFVANGVFAMSEMAVVSSRKARLRQMASEGHAGAVAALRLAEAPGRFLPTVQVGITLIGLFAGAFSGATLATELATAMRTLPGVAPYADAIAVGVVVIALTLASVIIGELVPKRIALAAPERIACRLARPIEWLSKLAQPIVHVLSGITDLLLRLLRVKQANAEAVSEDEVRLLLHEGTEAGVFHKDEPRMVESVLSLDRLPVREIMTPREKLVFLTLDDTHEKLWHKVVISGHSSYPVCESDRDYVIGVVAVKSVYANLAAGASVRVRDLMVAPLFLAPDEPVLTVLGRFKQSGIHIGIVREADGRAIGLLTLVDVLEAIVGDMPSLEERLRPAARQRPDGSWLVDGQYNLAKLAALLAAPIPPQTAEGCTTLATLVGERLNREPREGDSFECAGLRFEVIDMDRTSVDKVLIQRISASEKIHLLPSDTAAA